MESKCTNNADDLVSVLNTAVTNITSSTSNTNNINDTTNIENANGTDNSIPLPIIMYHGLLKDHSYQNKYFIHPDYFENDLKYIEKNGYTTIFISDLIAYVENGVPLPEKPIMLTFDDGYYNNYLYGFPLLEEYKAKAVISLIGKYTDDYTNVSDVSPYYSHITWEDARIMQNSGLVEFQNHSYNLHLNDNGRVGAAQAIDESYDKYSNFLKSDIELLQQEFFVWLSQRPLCFTYPFGSYTDNTDSVLKELGFKATLSCYEGLNYITKDPNCLFKLKRYLRPPDLSSYEFFSRFEVSFP